MHCRTYEPWHPFFSKNPAYYSEKFNAAGLTYELGVAIFESRLVWLRGPKPASNHDITVFQQELIDKIPDGKHVVSDKGYWGEPNTISTPNAHDPDEL